MIWKRFLFKESLYVFLFFTFGFYFLYVLIDYSVHAKSFTQHHFTFLDICYYYGCHLSKRAQIILPFALLLATLKTLTSLNIKRELIALLSGGIPLHHILKPILLLALLVTSLLYFNTEAILPISESSLQRIEESASDIKESEPTLSNIRSISMKDGSTLVFQNYDLQEQRFFDAFWIQDSDTLYRIKYFYPYEKVPRGEYVDLLKRNKEGRFFLLKSFEKHIFPQIHIEAEAKVENTPIPMNQSLSFLFASLYANKRQQGEIQAALTYKLLMPLLCFFVVLIPAPYCLQFGRNIPLFFIFAITIFGFVAFITIIGAALVVAENGVLHPMWTLLGPFITLLFLTYYNLTRRLYVHCK